MLTTKNRQAGKLFIYNEVLNIKEQLQQREQVNYCTSYLPTNLLFKMRKKLQNDFQVEGEIGDTYWLIREK